MSPSCPAHLEMFAAYWVGSTLSTEILPGTWSSSNSGTPGHRSSAVEPGRRGSFASAHRGSDVGSINDGPPKGGPPRTLSALEAYRAWERNVGLEQSEQGMGEEDGQGQGSSKRLRRKKPPPRELLSANATFVFFLIFCGVRAVVPDCTVVLIGACRTLFSISALRVRSPGHAKKTCRAESTNQQPPGSWCGRKRRRPSIRCKPYRERWPQCRAAGRR